MILVPSWSLPALPPVSCFEDLPNFIFIDKLFHSIFSRKLIVEREPYLAEIKVFSEFLVLSVISKPVFGFIDVGGKRYQNFVVSFPEVAGFLF